MSVGTSACALTVTRAAKRLVASGTNWMYELLTLTMTGHNQSPSNLILLLYRGSTIVALTEDLTGTSGSATGTLDLATEELEDEMDGVEHGAIMELDARLWDSSSLELIAEGTINIRAILGTYTTTAVTAISGTTIFWGDLCVYGGKTYLKNNDDGLWYPFSLRGTGDTVHYTVDETGGISIPGG